MERQTNKAGRTANKQTDRMTERQTDRQIGVQMSRQSGVHMDGQSIRQTDAQASHGGWCPVIFYDECAKNFCVGGLIGGP